MKIIYVYVSPDSSILLINTVKNAYRFVADLILRACPGIIINEGITTFYRVPAAGSRFRRLYLKIAHRNVWNIARIPWRINGPVAKGALRYITQNMLNHWTAPCIVSTLHSSGMTAMKNSENVNPERLLSFNRVSQLDRQFRNFSETRDYCPFEESRHRFHRIN